MSVASTGTCVGGASEMCEVMIELCVNAEKSDPPAEGKCETFAGVVDDAEPFEPVLTNAWVKGVVEDNCLTGTQSVSVRVDILSDGVNYEGSTVNDQVEVRRDNPHTNTTLVAYNSNGGNFEVKLYSYADGSTLACLLWG